LIVWSWLALSACSPIAHAIIAMRRIRSERFVRLDEPVRGDTRQPDMLRASRCAASGGRARADQGWSFDATRDGWIAAHVRSVHDSVVAVYQGERELDCDDDGAALGEPRLVFFARARQRYVIVVDGFGGERGPYELTMSRAQR
jgi:hypothetical protein